MASIDLGGGSVQEAYALSDEEAAAAPDKMYLTELHGGGKTYHVYVHRCVHQLSGLVQLPWFCHCCCLTLISAANQLALLPSTRGGEASCPASSCAATWATA